MAIIETVLAVAAYWGIAIYWETHLHLLISICVAPLLLLRSPQSTEAGARWFYDYMKNKTEISLKKNPLFFWAIVMFAATASGFNVYLLVLYLMDSYNIELEKLFKFYFFIYGAQAPTFALIVALAIAGILAEVKAGALAITVAIAGMIAGMIAEQIALAVAGVGVTLAAETMIGALVVLIGMATYIAIAKKYLCL
jgi:hypothetical protein